MARSRSLSSNLGKGKWKTFFIIFLEVQCFTNRRGAARVWARYITSTLTALSRKKAYHQCLQIIQVGYVHVRSCPIMSASCRAHMWLCALWLWTSEGFGSLFFHSFPFIPTNFHHIISIKFHIISLSQCLTIWISMGLRWTSTKTHVGRSVECQNCTGSTAGACRPWYSSLDPGQILAVVFHRFSIGCD